MYVMSPIPPTEEDRAQLNELAASFGGGMYNDWTKEQREQYKWLSRVLGNRRRGEQITKQNDAEEFTRLKEKYGWT